MHNPMGAPLSTLKTPKDITLLEAGDYEASSGVRIILTQTSVMFLAAVDGNDIVVGLPIDAILTALQSRPPDA